MYNKYIIKKREVQAMRDFFQIKEDYYRFEIYDLTAILTILNVVFVLMGYWWAPIFGLVNCAICIVMNVINRLHVNAYLTQVALIILNIYFLTL